MKSKSNTKKQIYKSNINVKYIQKQEFQPTVSYYTLFFEYLNKHYKNFYLSKCILTYTNNSELGYMSYNPLDIVSTKLNLDQLPNKIKEEYSLNKDKRFIIYPVGIRFWEAQHQNAIIIDTNKMEVEIFEPYGNIREKIKNDIILFDNIFYYDLIKRFTQKLLNKKVKLFQPSSFLPRKSLQYIEEEGCKKENYLINTPVGFCSAWTMWFIEMRIKFPDKPRNYFINKIMKHVKKGEIEDYVCLLIRNYSVFLSKLYNDLPLYKRIQFNMKYKYKHFIKKVFEQLLLVSLGYIYLEYNKKF